MPTTMIIDNLVANRAQVGCQAWALALVALAFLVCPSPTALAGPIVPGDKLAESDCSQLAKNMNLQGSKATELLIELKCKVVPIYENYLAQYRDNKPPLVLDDDAVSAKSFEELRQTIDEFVAGTLEVLSLRDFCTLTMFEKLAQLKKLIPGDNRLLTIAHDVLAIELHTSCLGKTISKLPEVPYLVKDIVGLYINGKDMKVKSLHAATDMSEFHTDDPFNVDLAIEKNGSLEDVVGLSLSLFPAVKNHDEKAKEFRESCKSFLIDIERCWDTMKMMSLMLNTNENVIERVNNYVLRMLAPTKYADICSKISARS